MYSEPLKTTFKRFCIAVIFSIAFAYIEAAAVVYMRIIFYPDGFVFPLTEFGNHRLWKPVLLIEICREAATLVLVFSSAWLFGRDLKQKFAYLLTIFGVWDIFYYIWLKILIGWPSSIMDWDILFLMPMAWASPVLAPVIISVTMLIFAVVLFYSSYQGRRFRINPLNRLGFYLASFVVIFSFCLAGTQITRPDFQSYFYWPLFAGGHLTATGFLISWILKSKQVERVAAKTQ